jgi:ABC-type dipeptide/oligopeptide/nickel transport system ATPase component
MSNLIAIVGPSGSGKSTSMFPNKDVGIKGLNPKETVFINVAAKTLPARGIKSMYAEDKKITEGGNYIGTHNAKAISQIIDFVNKNRTEIKNIVIDDAGLMMSIEAFEQAQTKGFDKFVTMAVNLFNILNMARQCRSDLNVIVTFHQEKGEDGLQKIRTIGRMLDNQIYLDSLFTFILYSQVIVDPKTNQVEYKFQTKSDGTSTCKSPIGCFKDMLIPNDLGLVVDTITEYYK